MKIKISDIIIKDRKRKEFDVEKIERLAQSIKEIGLIEPVVLERDNRLVAGERRVRAHQLLGLEEIEFVYMDCVDEWHRRAIELEENLNRENLTWAEEAESIYDVHQLYQEKFGRTTFDPGHGGKREAGGWTIDQTAEMLGMSKGYVVKAIQVVRGLQDSPELRSKETKEACFKAITVERELGMLREIAEVVANVEKERGEEDVRIILGDSVDVLKDMEEDSFDFCITDPPYSIGLHDMQDTFPNRGDVRQGMEFDDSLAVLDTVGKVMTEVYRILRPGSHCYVFFAIARYTEMKKLLLDAGFWIQPTPLFWIKNNALNLRPHIGFPVNYEPAWYCAKGYPPRPLASIQLKSTFDYPILAGSKKRHPAEKPLELIKEWMAFCSQPNERGIDPFNGGGTFTRALKEMGRRGVGVELSREWWVESKRFLEEGE